MSKLTKEIQDLSCGISESSILIFKDSSGLHVVELNLKDTSHANALKIKESLAWAMRTGYRMAKQEIKDALGV